MDLFFKGKSYGSVAQMLAANNFDVRTLRVNGPLLKDEWKIMDTAILKAYRERLVVVQDLMSRGLTVNLNEGLGTTIFEYQTMDDPGEARMDMEPTTGADNVRPNYGLASLPLPITHFDYFLSMRQLATSRKGNQPLDTTMAELAARRLAEYNEDVVVNGASNFSFGGATIYGLTDSPEANLKSISNWADSDSVSGKTIVEEVIEMKQLLINNRCFGPYIMYLPKNYETRLDEDYGTSYPKTIRQRLNEIEGLGTIRVVDKLEDHHVVFFQPTSDVIRLVVGLQTSNVTWEEMGGLQVRNKVMNIIVPQIRSDSGARNGLVHASYSA